MVLPCQDERIESNAVSLLLVTCIRGLRLMIIGLPGYCQWSDHPAGFSGDRIRSNQRLFTRVFRLQHKSNISVQY